MSSCGLLKRSSPSILRTPKSQRLNLRPFSTSSPPQPSLSSLSSSSNRFEEQRRSYNTWKSKNSTNSHSSVFLRSLSGIVVGSSLGLWLFSSSPESTFSFADWKSSTAFAKGDLQENPEFRGSAVSQSAPERRTKYLFPGDCWFYFFFHFHAKSKKCCFTTVEMDWDHAQFRLPDARILW